MKNTDANQSGAFGRGSKDRRTPRRTEQLADRRRRGAELASWLQDRLGLAQKRNAIDRIGPRRVSGQGETLRLKNISRRAAVREPEVLANHVSPNRAARRDRPGLPNLNVPYVNPARDLKPGRRLRAEPEK